MRFEGCRGLRWFGEVKVMVLVREFLEDLSYTVYIERGQQILSSLYNRIITVPSELLFICNRTLISQLDLHLILLSCNVRAKLRGHKVIEKIRFGRTEM